MVHSQLEKTIRLTHLKGDQHKTILITGEHFYIVVTRVNYLVIKMWYDRMKESLKQRPNSKIELPSKINWLVMIKSYRRKLDDLQNNNI